MTDQTNVQFACNVDVWSPEQRTRHGELAQVLRESGRRLEELDDGYQFHLDADAELFMQVAEFVTLERLCCPFFDFALEWPTDEGISLSIMGAEGVKAFVAQEFGLVPA